MNNYYKESRLSFNWNESVTTKSSRSIFKFIAGSLVFLSFLLGGLFSSLSSEETGVSEPNVVYAASLDELKAQKSELNKQYAEVTSAINYKQGIIDQGLSWWNQVQNAKYAKAKWDIGGLQKKQQEIKQQLDDVNNQKALVETEHALKEGSAKSQTEENDKKRAKTKSNYAGGTDQNIDTKEVDRKFTKDSRRSTTDAVKFISDDEATSALMESITKTVNSSVGGKYFLVYSKDGLLSFSSSIYRSLEKDDQRKLMRFTLKTVKESQLPSKVKTKVTAFISDQDRLVADSIQALNSDTSSELSAGYVWFLPFASPASTVLGFLAIVIFVFLTVSIVIDTAYLTVGIFRQFLESGEGKPKFVSGEAWDTAKEVDNSLQSGTYKDYLLVYFRKRIGIFIITSIVLAYLISGQIYSIFTTLLEVFEEIFSIRG